MTQFTTPKLGVKAGWELKESGWKEGMDRNMVVLSAVARKVVLSVFAATYPSTYAIGDMVMLGDTGESPEPELAGKNNWLAIRGELAWELIEPDIGWEVVDPAAGTYYIFNGYEWYAAPNPGAINYATVVDMAGDDYLMTKAEAEAGTIYIAGGVAGKTLTWPLSAEGTCPITQIVVSIFSSPGVLLKWEGYPNTVEVPLEPHLLQIFSRPVPGISILNSPRKGNRTILGVYDTVLSTDCGATLFSESDDPVTLDLSVIELSDQGFNFEVIQLGAGQVTFSPGFGVTLLNADGHTKTKGPGAVVQFRGGGHSEFIVFSGQTA